MLRTLITAGEQEVQDAGVVLAQKFLLKLCILCLHLHIASISQHGRALQPIYPSVSAHH